MERDAFRWGVDGSDPKMGDTHFYNYGSDCTDVRFYPRSKFVSEFGTQSYPSFSVLQNVTSPSDWSYTSDMSNYRCASQPTHLSVWCLLGAGKPPMQGHGAKRTDTLPLHFAF